MHFKHRETAAVNDPRRLSVLHPSGNSHHDKDPLFVLVVLLCAQHSTLLSQQHTAGSTVYLPQVTSKVVASPQSSFWCREKHTLAFDVHSPLFFFPSFPRQPSMTTHSNRHYEQHCRAYRSRPLKTPARDGPFRVPDLPAAVCGYPLQRTPEPRMCLLPESLQSRRLCAAA